MMLASDFGDAPDTGIGAGVGNYETLQDNGGASHVIDTSSLTLFLGNSVDSEDGTLQNDSASADDVNSALPDDEDGVLNPLDLRGTIGAAPTVTLLVTNTTGVTATLSGWIDYNRNGVFENEGERAQAIVPSDTVDGRITLVFPAIVPESAGRTYARFRLSTDASAEDATGTAADGEVEDYPFTVHAPSSGNISGIVKIADNTNGGPALSNDVYFGYAAASIGDLDRDGTTDMVVGSPGDSTGGTFSWAERGAVHVLFMNSDGSARDSVKIASSINGGPALSDWDFFGRAVTPVGDIDGDGVQDIVVGAEGDDTGGDRRGAVYVIFLNVDGTVKGFRKVASGVNGGPALSNIDWFGGAVASLGDLDGDGITDIAVGANSDDTGGNARGAVHILFLNSDGTVRNSTKIANNTSGGPVLANLAQFGRSLATLGDLDGDGVTELVVGVNAGIYVLFLNANGTTKRFVRIASNTGGGPPLPGGNSFGNSMSSPGDLDGNGLHDLVVGARSDDTGGRNRGAIYLLLMNADGTARSSMKIAHQFNGGPALDDLDDFGHSVTSLGDLSGDGVVELAVGAIGDDTGGEDRGAVYVLKLGGTLASPAISSPTGSSRLQRPEITWTAVPGASKYDVWIGNESAHVNPFHQATVNGTTYTPSVDLGIGRFNVWVRAKNGLTAGSWSPQHNFMIATRATFSAPPSDEDTLRPTLNWDPLPGAVRYDLWVDDRMGGVSQFIRDSNISDTTWTPSADMPLGRYHGWVRGVAADGTAGTWSVPSVFYVKPPPTITQGGSSTFDRTPEFRWNALPGAARYEVFVADRNVGTWPPYLYQRDITDLSFTVPNSMADGDYRFWVIGVSAVNVRSNWTEAVEIHIGGRTDLLTPSGTVNDSFPQFTWRAVEGAKHYDLWVDRVSGAQQVIREQELSETSFIPDAPLAAGDYRGWVRAVSTTGEFSPWSFVVPFTVAENSDSQPDQLGTEQLLSMQHLTWTTKKPESQAAPPAAMISAPPVATAQTETSSETESVPVYQPRPHAVLLHETFKWWCHRPLSCT